MHGPDPRKRAPRGIVAALIGAEAGAGIGLLFAGGRELAPLGLAAAGALAGPLVAMWLRALRLRLFRRVVREQLRGADESPNQAAIDSSA